MMTARMQPELMDEWQAFDRLEPLSDTALRLLLARIGGAIVSAISRVEINWRLFLPKLHRPPEHQQTPEEMTKVLDAQYR